jgi:membrane-associated protease RseP (regulator of RpoE activity)
VTRPRYLVHAALFAATCVTTALAGGAAFAATLMTILVCHEMGHYVVARRHGIDASLPYFIPLPPVISLGTLGAIIRMRSPIQDRNQLVDVGAAGPLAGLVVALPLLAYGLTLSPVARVDPGLGHDGALIEGNSLLYLALKYVVTGRYLPAADGTDVQLHPVAFAAWVGLLITMINLIPIGQLDGGHVACGFLGRRHEALSRRLHWLLGAVGAAVALGLALEAHGRGAAPGDALARGAWAGAPWLVWAAMILGMRRLSGGRYHPPVGETPLTAGRRRLVFLTAAIFVLIFTPIPLRQGL